MQTFYDLQQFLKSFGILIYMKDRKHTLSMVEYEVRELRRLELISKEEFLRAMAIIKGDYEQVDPLELNKVVAIVRNYELEKIENKLEENNETI